MKIFLIRHGELFTDTLLTDESQKKVQKVAAEIKKILGTQECKIITSPTTRTAQTAAIIGNIMNVAPRNEPHLAEKGNLGGFCQAMAELDWINIIIVTHNPRISDCWKWVEKTYPQLVSEELVKARGSLSLGGCVLIDLNRRSSRYLA